jgi:hypothetical protein
MSSSKNQIDEPPEIKAISAVCGALKGLDPSVQMRVLRYSAEILGLAFELPSAGVRGAGSQQSGDHEHPASTTSLPTTQSADDVDGISAVALKWMKRSGLEAKGLQSLFSLGIEEIDLVTKSVPGGSKKDRMRNVLLLKGIAAYLGTGTPRITYEQLKEACIHYDAYDNTNFARYLKSFAADVSGTKEAGFTLSARGLNSGTDLVKELLGLKS